MLDKVSGTIVAVNVLPEYEDQYDQEIDITLESGPTVEMCVTEDVVKRLREHIDQIVSFDITDRSPCGQHVRAVAFELAAQND